MGNPKRFLASRLSLILGILLMIAGMGYSILFAERYHSPMPSWDWSGFHGLVGWMPYCVRWLAGYAVFLLGLFLFLTWRRCRRKP